MKRYSGIFAILALAGCSGDIAISDGSSSGGGTTTPTVAVNQVLLDDASNNLTMSVAEYDAGTGELSLANLPFDASDDAYTLIIGASLANGFAAYESNPASSDATMHYLAVFRRSDSGNSQVAAAGTGQFSGVGYAGASAERLNASISLPGDGNYTYTGEYAGIRVTEGNGGAADAQLVTGNSSFDIDFDDAGTGVVAGFITNRVTYDTTGTADGGTLDNLALVLSSIDRDSAKVNEGTIDIGASTDLGTWQAVFAGPNGEELAGIILVNDTDGSGLAVRETGGFIAD